MSEEKRFSELLNEPYEVIFLKMAAVNRIPVGLSVYNRIINKYPDYFPSEYAHNKKWESIPKEVHDAKFKEWFEFKDKLWENEPKSPGIMAHARNTKEAQEWNEAYERLRPIEKKKEDELYNKYYSKFGLTIK